MFLLRKLLPQTGDYDFNVHVMDFAPGEYLNVKEVHYNQHGLLLAAGQGIYRLADQWYPVQSGDAIWCASFGAASTPCPLRCYCALFMATNLIHLYDAIRCAILGAATALSSGLLLFVQLRGVSLLCMHQGALQMHGQHPGQS